MPDKPLTIATYAAGASLAAITLVYVFGPTFFLDDSSSSRKKASVVGLSNPANDCFINAVLQALAGLPDLRKYLIREVHRRQLGGEEGVVTQALKEVLDRLNERPIYRKTISAQAFVSTLEQAFRTRISRQQQDAQEFLQIVTERLEEEYLAGRKARRKARRLVVGKPDGEGTRVDGKGVAQDGEAGQFEQDKGNEAADEDEQEEDSQEEDEEKDAFPFEGKIESQIECVTCHFKPKPTVSTFVTLTLNVPQQSSTSLNSCFDGMLKVEHIDDFKCEYCRLAHALSVKQRELASATSPRTREALAADITRIEKAMAEDPEKPPKDVTLPDSKLAPRRRIARHMRISSFPKVLGIHLSRSIYSASSLSTKNTAKVAFPESLPLGGILNQKKYRLLGVVTHKGGHDSGHYESFRRQVTPVPYSTPHSFGTEGAYSVVGTPNPSVVPSPRIPARDSQERPGEHGSMSPPSVVPDPSLLSPSPSSSSASSRSSRSRAAPISQPRDEGSLKPPRPSESSQPRPSTASASMADMADMARFRRKAKKKKDDRWWRISDDKIRECRTTEVLGMQKEVYLLFYELDRREGDGE
ncbi:hypothetical protein H2199_000470 [Coniosporium tulheliwenetii]|uniref:Uncharacterized protein n=1 Tax=Coniosporium tulheliwenetii TaxID=3383036 RepID=A0ACC2ZQ20_9PEZI|nr:hypothetical protein H2199_000470 [Cladosporium sp. JES 115]